MLKCVVGSWEEQRKTWVKRQVRGFLLFVQLPWESCELKIPHLASCYMDFWALYLCVF